MPCANFTCCWCGCCSLSSKGPRNSNTIATIVLPSCSITSFLFWKSRVNTEIFGVVRIGTHCKSRVRPWFCYKCINLIFWAWTCDCSCGCCANSLSCDLSANSNCCWNVGLFVNNEEDWYWVTKGISCWENSAYLLTSLGIGRCLCCLNIQFRAIGWRSSNWSFKFSSPFQINNNSPSRDLQALLQTCCIDCGWISSPPIADGLIWRFACISLANNVSLKRFKVKSSWALV